MFRERQESRVSLTRIEQVPCGCERCFRICILETPLLWAPVFLHLSIAPRFMNVHIVDRLRGVIFLFRTFLLQRRSSFQRLQ